MWFVDACFEYAEIGTEYFSPSSEAMLNDAYLGLYVIALALVIWVIYLLIKDPKRVVRQRLFKK